MLIELFGSFGASSFTDRSVLVVLAGVALLATALSLLAIRNGQIRGFKKYESTSKTHAKSLPTPEQLGRSYGHWTPRDYPIPVPARYPDWSVTLTKPLPYRPFKHNYFVTMGIRNLNFDDWIELDNEWDKFYKRKLERLAEPQATDLWKVDERALPAVEEMLDHMIEYLPARYPSLFEKTSQGIRNLHTGESFDCISRPWKEHPMVIASKLIQDDLAIVIEGEDGQYYLLAASILLAGFWRLRDKFGRSLQEIHTSGDVPEFNKIQRSMEKFLLKMEPEKGVIRHNYYVQTDEDIAWSYAIGPEESPEIGWRMAEKPRDITKLHFRSERQTLRRLPKTGGIVFTIRTYFVPIVDICEEPFIPGRLLDAINSWQGETVIYKGLDNYKDLIMPYLEKKAAEQHAAGFTKEREGPSRYPY